MTLGASLHKDGIVANGVELFIRKWMKDRNELGAVFSDSSTAFAHVSVLADSRNTEHCRMQLKLPQNVDMAIICTVSSVHYQAVKNGNVTVWMCSDLKETMIKLTVYGDVPEDFEQVGKGSVIAVLNPDMNDISKDANFRGISIKNCENVLLIGEIDGIEICKGVTVRGTPCKNVVYIHYQGEFCKFHTKATVPKAKTKSRKRTLKLDPASKGFDMVDDITKMYMKEDCEEEAVSSFEFKTTEPPKPEKVLFGLGGLGNLMNRVMQQRNGSTNGTSYLNVIANCDNQRPPKSRKLEEPVVDRTKKFESAVSNLKSLIHKDEREYKKIIGVIQALIKYVHHINGDVIARTGITNTCSRLLDHPIEDIAIESLKLQRTLRKLFKLEAESNRTSLCMVGKVNQVESKANNKESVLECAEEAIETT